MEYGIFVSNEYGRMLFLEHSSEYKDPYPLGKQCMIYHCQLLNKNTYLGMEVFRSPFASNQELYKPEDTYYWLTRDI